jgi:hypothetical protein
MTDAIKPVLSADEWRPFLADRHFAWDQYVLQHTGYDMTTQRPEEVAARALAGLPDDSLYKITRADVDGLERASSCNSPSLDDYDCAGRVLAILRSLLPPDATDVQRDA